MATKPRLSGFLCGQTPPEEAAERYLAEAAEITG